MAKEFGEVETEEIVVNAFAAALVRQPEAYDVVIASNFHEAILSDPAFELCGSLGLGGSINANAENGLCCAQAQRGSPLDIAGRNIANPTALILSAAMMLKWPCEQRDSQNLME